MKYIKQLIIIFAIMFITSVALAATNVTFQWNANSESDLAGYKLYRSVNPAVTPFDAFVDVPLASLTDPSNPEFTWNGIPDGTWYFAATAYDTSGNESGYSNIITDTFDTSPPTPPSNLSIWQKIIAWLKYLFNLG